MHAINILCFVGCTAALRLRHPPAIEEAKRLNWRLHDITITVVNRLDD